MGLLGFGDLQPTEAGAKLAMGAWRDRSKQMGGWTGLGSPGPLSSAPLLTVISGGNQPLPSSVSPRVQVPDTGPLLEGVEMGQPKGSKDPSVGVGVTKEMEGDREWIAEIRHREGAAPTDRRPQGHHTRRHPTPMWAEFTRGFF